MDNDFLSKAALDALVAAELSSGSNRPAEVRQETTKNKSIGPWPYAALMAGQGLDVGATLQGWSKGDVESNPIFTGGRGSPNYNPHPTGKVLAAKAGLTAGIAGLMKLMDSKGQDTGAKILGYGSGLLGAIPGIRNLMRPWDKD